MVGRTSVCLARPEKDRSSGGITEQFLSVLPIVFVVIILSCLDGVLVEARSLTAGRWGATLSHSPLSPRLIQAYNRLNFPQLLEVSETVDQAGGKLP